MSRRAEPGIDFDRYHRRARKLRHRARAAFMRRLIATLRALIPVSANR